MTTYNVVPVSAVLGLLAFVSDTEPLLKLLEHGQTPGTLEGTIKQHAQDICDIGKPSKPDVSPCNLIVPALKFLPV